LIVVRGRWPATIDWNIACNVVRVVYAWGYQCRSRLPLEKISRQVVQLQQLVCCSDLIGRRACHVGECFPGNDLERRTGTPFCPQYVAGARPSALIATVLHPLRSIFTSPPQSIEHLARQLGNGWILRDAGCCNAVER